MANKINITRGNKKTGMILAGLLMAVAVSQYYAAKPKLTDKEILLKRKAVKY